MKLNNPNEIEVLQITTAIVSEELILNLLSKTFKRIMFDTPTSE